MKWGDFCSILKLGSEFKSITLVTVLKIDWARGGSRAGRPVRVCISLDPPRSRCQDDLKRVRILLGEMTM